MTKTKVGILRGGLGYEYDVSLKTGSNILSNLDKSKYEPYDILITKDGTWHHSGLPIDPYELKDIVDMVFNALHGEFGEDGEVQSILEDIDIPYTGSRSRESKIAFNKREAKEILRSNGILTPYSLTFDVLNINEDIASDVAQKVFMKISPEWIVKPVDKGSSVGVYHARNLDELKTAILKAGMFSNQVMIEEFIKGREVTSGVVNGLRGHDLYRLPNVEILKKNKPVWDYESKYSSESGANCPSCLLPNESLLVEETASRIHNILNLKHYSRSDFILNNRGLYALEVNTLPELTENSTFIKSLNHRGVSPAEFLDHIITLAQEA